MFLSGLLLDKGTAGKGTTGRAIVGWTEMLFGPFEVLDSRVVGAVWL